MTYTGEQDSGYSVADYVTLNLQDSQVNGFDYSWDIPQSYYTNRRAIATVTVVRGGAKVASAVLSGLNVYYVNGGQNSYSSGNDPPAIGFGDFFTATLDNVDIRGGVELLTVPRPNRITLRIMTPARETAELRFMVICLKFCYYNQAETGKALHNTYAPLLT